MRLKQFSAIFLSVLLIGTMLPLQIFAKDATTQSSTSNKGAFSEKDEVIYGKLSPHGKIGHMYVVNSFHETTNGRITDHGNYKDIRNLTDLSSIEQDGKKITFEASDEEFYYQGELADNLLPWNIDIKYFLDDVEKDAAELAGETGRLDIHIDITENDDVDPVFFDYYLLQISLTFDPLIFHDIEAPKGTEANEGKNKLINFSAMPGQEDLFITTAFVEELEMDPISISAIPANLAIDDPDVSNMTDDMKTLADAIQEVHEGVTELNDGVADLHDGTSELSDGSQQFLSGLQTIDGSSAELVDGSQIILDVFQDVQNMVNTDMDIDMPDLDDLVELPEILKSISEQVEGFAKLFNQLDEAIQDIPSSTLDGTDISDLNGFIEANEADDSIRQTVDQLIETYYAAQAVRQISENLPGELGSGAEEIATYISILAEELESNLSQLDGLDELAELQDGLLTMASEYETFHNGLVEYTDGVHELAKNYRQIDQGISELTDGTKELKDGVSELHDGTKELHEETSDLPDEMQSEIDAFMEDFDFSGFEAKSFVASENKNIGVVQFVLQTESIELPEIDDEESIEEEAKSIWQRFLDLFR